MDVPDWFDPSDRWQIAEASWYWPLPATHYRRDDRRVPGSADAAAWEARKAELREMANAPMKDLNGIVAGIRRTNESVGISMTEEQVLRAAKDVQANGWKRAAEDLANMEWDELIAAVVRLTHD